LALAETAITDRGLGYLHEPALRVFHLDNDAGVTDEGMKAIARLPNVERIYLNNTNISAKGIAYMAPWKNLNALHVDSC